MSFSNAAFKISKIFHDLHICDTPTSMLLCDSILRGNSAELAPKSITSSSGNFFIRFFGSYLSSGNFFIRFFGSFEWSWRSSCIEFVSGFLELSPWWEPIQSGQKTAYLLEQFICLRCLILWWAIWGPYPDYICLS